MRLPSKYKQHKINLNCKYFENFIELTTQPYDCKIVVSIFICGFNDMLYNSTGAYPTCGIELFKNLITWITKPPSMILINTYHRIKKKNYGMYRILKTIGKPLRTILLRLSVIY